MSDMFGGPDEDEENPSIFQKEIWLDLLRVIGFLLILAATAFVAWYLW